MDTATRLQKALSEGESETIEFKIVADHEFLPRDICAFANAKGGTIFVGVADPGRSGKSHVGGASIVGVDPESVLRITSPDTLPKFFDGPTPGVQSEMLDVKGPDGPAVVAVHVSSHSGSDMFALSDLSIWIREGTHTVSHTTRVRSATLADPLEFSDSMNVDVTKSSPDSGDYSIVPLSEIYKFNLTSTVLGALGHAQQIIRENGHEEPINSSHFILGMVLFGRERGDTPHFAKFLADEVFPKYERGYERTLSSYNRRTSERLKRYSGTTSEHINSEHATRNLLLLFKDADELRLQVAPPDEEHWLSGRHLLGTILRFTEKDSPSGAVGRLKEIGLSRVQLRKAFLQLMVREGPRSERDEWRKYFNASVPASLRIAQFNADRAGDGADRLQITDDVNAMANLIACQTLRPPLSIGLFGNWGSGKSFFIHKLHTAIDKLANRAQASREAEEHYWPNIVQIKFNAWNYIDANLWASLVSHIFEQLDEWRKQPRLSDFEKVHKDAIEKLKLATEARAEASTRLLEAKRIRQAAQERRDQRLDALKKKRNSLIEAIGADVWKEVRGQVRADSPDLQRHLDDMGIASEQIQESAQQVYEHVQEMATLGGRIRAVWLTMLGGKGVTVLGISAVVVCSVAILFLAGLLTPWMPHPNVDWLLAIAGEAAVLLGGLAAWTKMAAGKVAVAMKPLRQLHATIDSTLKEAERRKAQSVAELEQQLQQHQAEYAAAVEELDEAEAAVYSAEAELRDVETGKLITRFIEQRASSGDYRKHLGIVATIRDDFQQLSKLIAGYNDFRRNGRGQNGTDSPQNLGINRIVLYIDDLDRCPPDRVIEVLQAIHLLLAFPLFVVVVAVDSRWVSFALQKEYPDLLIDPMRQKPGATPSTDSGTLAPSASPRDYLEKIFQVPFWIRPMDDTGCGQLIDDLIELATIPATQESEQQQSGETSNESEPAEEEVIDEETEPSEPETPEPGEPVDPDDHEGQGAPKEPQPESLRLDQVEITSMKQLAGIIGRSPRETKRFVNVYRLMKAALTEGELVSFVGTGAAPGSFRVPMCLLALSTGAPHVASILFHQVADADGQTQSSKDTSLSDLMTSIEPKIPTPLEHEWDRVKRFLDRNDHWNDLVVERRWVTRVSQFSFEPSIPPEQADS